VVPSVYEPFGMVALEAHACKRPVIASRVGGLKEVVTHRVNGFLSKSKDHLDLAQWMMTLLHDPQLRHRLGEAGFGQIAEHGYTWPDVAEQYMSSYHELTRSGPNTTVNREASAFVEQIHKMAPEGEGWEWRYFLQSLFQE
jgi:glycosyltransferase involved in cell wall biosynthesis